MAKGSQSTQWLSIADFKPGIHENLSPSYPPGTAQETNTYRCFAMASGALAPLPITHTQSFTISDPVNPATLSSEEFRVIGLEAIGPLYWAAEATPGTDQNNTEIFVGIEYWVADDQYLEVWRYKRHYLSTPVWEKVWTSTAVAGTYDATIRPANFVFGWGRSNSSDPSVSGPSVVTWAGAGYAQEFPDDAAPSVVGTAYLPGDKSDPANAGSLCSPDIIVMHQGRAIIFPLLVLAFGDSAVYAHNESIYFSSFNNYKQRDPSITSYWNIAVGPESPVGYACVAALSANELFLLKRKGGAHVITGDVAGVGPSSPTVRAYPFIKSPGFTLNNGTITPQGFAYVVDSGGVWVWQGGDISQNITPHLPDNFWRPEPIDMAGNAVAWGYQWTQCDQANTFTLFPNNWVWDTEQNGWWKVDDPTQHTIYRWSTDWRFKKAYGAPSGFRGGASGDPTILEFDLTTPADSYSWQSQPLSTTIDKSVAVMQMGIVGSGEGTVTLTVTSRQDQVGQTRTFTFSDTSYPEFQVNSCGVRGTHLVFRVEAEASVAGQPAPTVHEIRYDMAAPNPV